MNLTCIVCVSALMKNMKPAAFVLSTIDQCEQFGVETIVRDLCHEHRRIHDKCKTALDAEKAPS